MVIWGSISGKKEKKRVAAKAVEDLHLVTEYSNQRYADHGPVFLEDGS
jgi:hypothetical protein